MQTALKGWGHQGVRSVRNGAPSGPVVAHQATSRPAHDRAMHSAVPACSTTQLPLRALSRHSRHRTVTPAAAADSSQPGNGGALASVEGTSTFSQAVFNVINVMCGVGLLSLPFAFKSSGWVGIILLWLMGFVANYTGKALVECANEVCKRRNLGKVVVGYEEIAEEAFGKLGRMLISSIIYVELFGTCCLLFILEGDNLFSILGPKTLAPLATSAAHFMLLAAAVMIPTVWLPNLSSLSFLGIFGVTATCTVVASVTYTLLTGSFVPGAVTHPALWATLPLVFGICTFCYSGHGVFPAIQASMKEPERFPEVLNVAYLGVALLCTFVGCAGYYMYGSAAADVVIFNLPTALATICSCLVLVNPIAKFALTMEPVAAAASTVAGGGKPVSGLPRLAVRTTLAIAILMAARSLPFLAYLMALVGSFMTISVSVTFPALCHLVLCKKSSSPVTIAWNWFVAGLGVTCTLFGTAASMRSLAAKAAGL